MSKKEIWLSSTNEEYWSGGEEYDSAAEAALHAGEDNDLEDGDAYYIGKQADHYPEVKADDVIEQLVSDACDEVGDVAEDWLSSVTAEQKAQLQVALTETLNLWMDKHKLHPPFYKIENMTDHVWGDEPCI